MKKVDHEASYSILSMSMFGVVQALEEEGEESHKENDVTVNTDGGKKADDDDDDENDDANSSIDYAVNDGKEIEEQGQDAQQEEMLEGESPVGISDDAIEDGFFDPITPDPSCDIESSDNTKDDDCWNPPESTIEKETVIIDATAMYGGDDPDSLDDDDDNDEDAAVVKKTNKPSEEVDGSSSSGTRTKVVDKHWGSDENTLKMRDTLRNSGKGTSASFFEKKRPPIFLMPGLASTRLVSWKYKSCNNKLLSDVKVQDYVWMNINMLIQMATIDATCFLECMTLGLNQTDMDDDEIGCKLRPDEGLDAISSLAPGSVTTNMLVGGKNTVYAWLTQWLADNLGYDVSSIVGLPYDWRLSPDVMEKRDGFLTLTRKRIEASVKSNGSPGIMVAHSMGNNVFRYFLEWLKNQLHEEAYARLAKNLDEREIINRGRRKDESAAFLGPAWTNGGGTSHLNKGYEYTKATEPIIEYSVKDQMYTLANSFVNSIDGLWQTYFPGESVEKQYQLQNPTQTDNFMDDFSEWQKANKGKKHPQLWELAQSKGDEDWVDWIQTNIWTYIGLSAPLLGAMNPVRAVISGENMGMPMADKDARTMELSFGSTHTINPVSTKTGFCDDILGKDYTSKSRAANRSNLACLDELIQGIERRRNEGNDDPWHDFDALKSILKDRVDWDSTFPPFTVQTEKCNQTDKPPCKFQREVYFNAKDVQSGKLFDDLSKIFNETGQPLKVKRDQLENSWWQNPLPNILDSTWDRPHIKHVIMAYGVDYDTEVGYVYRKRERSDTDEEFDEMPTLKTIVHEEAGGRIYEENRIEERKSLMKKAPPKTRELKERGEGILKRSGDASVPYLSLAWSHTWLLHATRAMRHSSFKGMKEGERISDDNALDSIKVTYRPKGGSEWLDIASKRKNETISQKSEEINPKANSHPHGTKYKPEMYRYQSKGRSRSTGMEYTTAIIEAVGVEHKETTRNYDILAAVFTDVLKNMHDDFDFV
eukprot:CAMPEP_0203668388 /NCGR_PEP_ID=MMETSP0090-20130426/5028_1 /ASSEMBLY_ACC=CAM_ASM_001088 /TAXON_ID=426623 /ORGANISM="Chaetoceros affinis, Strain CCMP159" /LENGTH=987 /DNA_ID=CAMNT_0050532809 /DNA_START=363 /DNA_END=3326 /DNA_ORIENTATION=-